MTDLYSFLMKHFEKTRVLQRKTLGPVNVPTPAELAKVFRITPQRIQLKRTKGFNLQEASQKLNGLRAVACCRPSDWGNPFKVGVHAKDAAAAVTLFEVAIRWHPTYVLGVRRALRGKNLACYCALDQPCHCDVLLRIANFQ